MMLDMHPTSSPPLLLFVPLMCTELLSSVIFENTVLSRAGSVAQGWRASLASTMT
jgi:hypothetical protein